MNYTGGDQPSADPRLAWAEWYVSLGWKVLVLAVDGVGGKKPPANCPRCDFAGNSGPPAPAHDMRSCPCLTCHGIHAATADTTRIELMLERLPRGYLAVATGASGLLALDVENRDRGLERDERTPKLRGVEILERWDLLTGWSLPDTLTARTVSGGVHLLYRWSGGTLPNDLERDAIEVKTGDRYVAVPCGRNDREWLDTSVPVADTPAALVDMLRRPMRSRRTAARGTGATGAPPPETDGPLPDTEEFQARGLGWFTGSRNTDTYRLACRLWRLGYDERDVEEILRECWDATPDQTASSWTEHWRTALSARRRMDETAEAELAEARAFMRRFSGQA